MPTNQMLPGGQQWPPQPPSAGQLGPQAAPQDAPHGAGQLGQGAGQLAHGAGQGAQAAGPHAGGQAAAGPQGAPGAVAYSEGIPALDGPSIGPGMALDGDGGPPGYGP